MRLVKCCGLCERSPSVSIKHTKNDTVSKYLTLSLKPICLPLRSGITSPAPSNPAPPEYIGTDPAAPAAFESGNRFCVSDESFAFRHAQQLPIVFGYLKAASIEQHTR